MLNRDEVLELLNLVSFHRDHQVGVLQRLKTIPLLLTKNSTDAVLYLKTLLPLELERHYHQHLFPLFSIWR